MLLSWEIFFSDKVEQLPSQHVQQLLRAGLEGGIDVIDSKMSEGGGLLPCACVYASFECFIKKATRFV